MYLDRPLPKGFEYTHTLKLIVTNSVPEKAEWSENGQVMYRLSHDTAVQLVLVHNCVLYSSVKEYIHKTQFVLFSDERIVVRRKKNS